MHGYKGSRRVRNVCLVYSGIVMLFLVWVLCSSPRSGADDRSPTLPDITSEWCPAGDGWVNVNLDLEQCDGADYPDGSFWRQERHDGATQIFRECLTHHEDEFGTPVPSQTCGMLV
jgi:hypothetical protein